MPLIELFPTRVSLSLSAGQGRHSAGDRSLLSFVVRSTKPWRNEVRLATGEKFAEMRGGVAIHSGQVPSDWPLVPKPTMFGAPSKEKIPAVGLLTYSGPVNDEFASHSASYDAEIWLPPSQFDEVMQAARIGKMPRAIVLEVVGEGFKYGSMPDGSDKDWDNKTNPQLMIIEASIHLVLGASNSDIDEEAEERGIPVPEPAPTGAQIAQLLRLVEGLPIKLFGIGALLVGVLVFFLRR